VSYLQIWYSETCLFRSPLGQAGGFIRQVTLHTNDKFGNCYNGQFRQVTWLDRFHCSSKHVLWLIVYFKSHLITEQHLCTVYKKCFRSHKMWKMTMYNYVLQQIYTVVTLPLSLLSSSLADGVYSWRWRRRTIGWDTKSFPDVLFRCPAEA